MLDEERICSNTAASEFNLVADVLHALSAPVHAPTVRCTTTHERCAHGLTRSATPEGRLLDPGLPRTAALRVS